MTEHQNRCEQPPDSQGHDLLPDHFSIRQLIGIRNSYLVKCERVYSISLLTSGDCGALRQGNGSQNGKGDGPAVARKSHEA